MRFRRHQERARAASRALLFLFALTVLFTVAGVNLALALAWRLQFGALAGYPAWFFETNTVVTLGFVLGGAWVESLQLRDGGAHVARMVGGREVVAPRDAAERRLRNVVDEVAIAAGLKSPRIYVLDREDAINALAAGWDQQDSVVAVTRGALERLTRDELQGVVAHEFAHILNGDTRLNMRLIGMVFGLQLVFNFGRSLMSVSGDRGRRGPALLAGVALVVAGSIGWLAGRLLKAGVSRQREHLADAHAVQFTRQPTGIGGALRKVAGQLGRGQRMQHVNAEVLSHLLLSSDTLVRGGWFATHPPIGERVRRIFGHPMPPLPDDPIVLPEPPGPQLPPLEFQAAPALAAGVEDNLPPAWPESMTPWQLHAAVLACLVPRGSESRAELAAWRRSVGSAAGSLRELQAVQALPPRHRLPRFEQLLRESAALAPSLRAALRHDALAVVQADGRLSLHEYLQARVLQRHLSGRREHPAFESRHLPIGDMAGPILTVTWALASLLAAADRLPWTQAVCRGLGIPAPLERTATGLRELDPAIERLARLGRMHRPALAKQWLEACEGRLVPQSMADAMRCLCLLIDTPLPPALSAHFDPLPALA